MRGWRYPVGEPVEIELDAQGRLWSEQLESWLLVDGFYLRLYDRAGQLRLTEAEADFAAYQSEATARQAAEAARKALEAQLETKDQQLAEMQRQIARFCKNAAKQSNL